MKECTISNVEKIGIQVVNTCFGVFSLMLGDIKGGLRTTTTGLISLAGIGSRLQAQSATRVRATAQKRAMEALNNAPEYRQVNPDRLLALLSGDIAPLSRSDLIDVSKSASGLDLDAALAQRVHQVLPFNGDDEATRKLAYLVLEAGMRACNADKGFQEEVKSTQLLHLVQTLTRVDDKLDQVSHQQRASDQKLDTLIRQNEGKARELKLTEKLFISLARRIATDVTDIDQAHRELERVVEVASDEQARSALPSNTDEAVTAILARVDELNDDGQIDTAAKLIADEESRVEAGLLRLYDKGIAQAILTRDVGVAHDYELKKLSLTVPEDAQFEALCRVQDGWYAQGRDRGLNFELAVSIALARSNLARAQKADQRGAAQNDLGIALQTLGERDTSTERLEEAVVAYRAALQERTQIRVPLAWASTQNNLGNALSRLGERENSNDRLEEAVAAFRAALQERTRIRAPLDWAGTQNNLGATLQALGSRENSTERLEEAVAAYRAALEERTQIRAPLDWAGTQDNLGNALSILGERENSTERLEEAVVAYRAALQERTQIRVPLSWAGTQNNLGTALQALGARNNNTDRLEEAIVAFRAALEEYKRARVPLNWAGTQNNLGTALQELGARESSTERLEEAVIAYQAALEEYTQEHVPFNWAIVRENLARVEKAFADHPATVDSRSHLQAALIHVEAALQVFNAEMTPFNQTRATRLCDDLRARLEDDD